MELSKKCQKQTDELLLSSLHSDCLRLCVCRYRSKLNGQKPQTCLLLFFGVDYSTLKSWGCPQLPHGEGIRTLCKIFNTVFPTHWEFLSKKASVQPVSSPWNPPFPRGGEPACKGIANVHCPCFTRREQESLVCPSLHTSGWQETLPHCLRRMVLGHELGWERAQLRQSAF